MKDYAYTHDNNGMQEAGNTFQMSFIAERSTIGNPIEQILTRIKRRIP